MLLFTIIAYYLKTKYLLSLNVIYCSDQIAIRPQIGLQSIKMRSLKVVLGKYYTDVAGLYRDFFCFVIKVYLNASFAGRLLIHQFSKAHQCQQEIWDSGLQATLHSRLEKRRTLIMVYTIKPIYKILIIRCQKLSAQS